MNLWLDIVSKFSVAAVLGLILWRIAPVLLGFIKRTEKKQDDAEKRIVELTDSAHEMNREYTKVLDKYSNNAGEVARQMGVVAKHLGVLVERSDKTESEQVKRKR